MIRILAATMLVIALLCAGCAGTTANVKNETTEPTQAEGVAAAPEPEPEWVEDAAYDYPRMQYITARGEGDSAEAAAQHAMGHIAALFLVDTAEYDMDVPQAVLAADYELNNTYLGDSVQSVAAPDAKRLMEKIELAGQWHDVDNGVYHALAILPRNNGLGYLTEQIKALDEKTRAYMQDARSNIDPFTQAGMIARAWRCQQMRGKLQDSMRVADLTARGIAPQWKLNLMKQDALNLIATLQIQPAGLEEEANARRVHDMIKVGLIDADLKPTETNADYVLRGSLEAGIAGAENGWAVGHGVLKLVFADKVTGQVRGSKVWEVDVPGLNEDAAIRRVYEKTEYMLKVRMRDLLMEIAMQ